MGMKLFALAIAALFLAGCATFSGTSASEKLAVQVATMKFIESGDNRMEKAARIRAAAEQARIWLDTENVTLASLQAAMIARVNSADLEPSDRLLAAALVDVVAAEIDARIGAGVISPEKKATVNTVLAWVIQAAEFYS